MKKRILISVIFASIIAATIVFYACEKESTNQKSQELNNPYDYFGQIHNEAMDFVLHAAKKNETIDLHNFTLHFLTEKFQKISFAPQQNWNERLSQVLSHLNKYEDIFFRTNLKGPFNDTVLNLSNTQQMILNFLFENIENGESMDEINYAILQAENKALTIPMNEEERWFLLGTISIAKYSSIFFEEHGKEIISDVDAKGPFQNFINAAKNVVKADAIGFVAGVASGIVQGHAQTAMVFGPEGAVVALASDGAAGAIVGSGSQVIVEVAKSK